ncbi:MAG TPA: GNAT family protein [Terracidiphilus sp.]|nr:GNAT family protein [Terracidiphilus sp.]
MQPLNWKPAQPPGPVTLRGRYVTLEPLDAAHHTAALWQAVRGRDDVWTWLPDGPFVTEAEFRAAIEKKQHGESSVFLGVVPVGADAQGYASFMRIDAANGAIEVGNILFAPALQRTRAATEAMYLMASHVFDHLGYRRYEWKCNALNEPSRRAAQRFGFTFEGIFRQHMVVKGFSRDTAWFAMLDSEWPARRKAFESWLDPSNFDERGAQRRGLIEFAAGCAEAGDR